jgi:hypothetical protein
MGIQRRAILALVIGMLTTSCDDNNYNSAAIGNPLAPINPGAADTVVEFRVTGDLPIVTVRVSNSLDGLTQITTVLPYSQRITIHNEPLMFLALDARAVGSGFLHVAIFVNGTMFREASTSTFAPFVAVSGTYRRGVN